jgi:hypothetical protein
LVMVRMQADKAKPVESELISFSFLPIYSSGLGLGRNNRSSQCRCTELYLHYS